jgi:diguanylate cyclase (GGDEF)-like protein/PAS domain S-box-containing protein
MTYLDGSAGRPIYVSPQIEALCGYTPEEWLASEGLWRRCVHPADRARVMDQWRRSKVERSAFLSEYRMTRRDGRVVWVRDEAVLVPGPRGEEGFWQGVVVDVTARREAEDRVEFLAFHDKLTELPNRALFEQLLEQSLRNAERHGTGVAVLSLDVDGLKLVNDSLGHEAGDELLRHAAAALRDSTRQEDVAARVGGDEFVVLAADLPVRDQPGAALAAAESMAARVLERLRQPVDLRGTEFYPSTSIGISVYPLDANDAASLVRNADAAMYQAKRTAPGSYVMSSGAAGAFADALTKASRLRQAAREGLWALEYQPIVELRTRTVAAFESLLRWHQPDGRTAAAWEFIDLAEEMGLMPPIMDWVLGELCRWVPRWRGEGWTFGVSFNLSARQLWERSLPERIFERLAASGLDPRGLTVEVTESGVMSQPEHAGGILRALHDGGIRVAIDDFGTGYSSLSRLRELPVDVVKIDRSFVRDLPADRDARSIVRAMLQLATSLEIVPLAEGIETEEQLEFLREHGCVLGQGYLFARAMSAERVSSFVGAQVRAVPA